MKRNQPENDDDVIITGYSSAAALKAKLLAEWKVSNEKSSGLTFYDLVHDVLDKIFSCIPFGYLPYIAQTCKIFQKYSSFWFYQYSETTKFESSYLSEFFDHEKINSSEFATKLVPPIRPSPLSVCNLDSRFKVNLGNVDDNNKFNTLGLGISRESCIYNIAEHGDLSFLIQNLKIFFFENKKILAKFYEISYKYDHPDLRSWVESVGYKPTRSEQLDAMLENCDVVDIQQKFKTFGSKEINLKHVLKTGRFAVLQKFVQSFNEKVFDIDGVIETLSAVGNFEQINWCLDNLDFGNISQRLGAPTKNLLSSITTSRFLSCIKILVCRKDLELAQKFLGLVSEKSLKVIHGHTLRDYQHVVDRQFEDIVNSSGILNNSNDNDRRSYILNVVEMLSIFSTQGLRLKQDFLTKCYAQYGLEIIKDLQKYIREEDELILDCVGYMFNSKTKFEEMKVFYEMFPSPKCFQKLIEVSVENCNFAMFDFLIENISPWDIHSSPPKMVQRQMITEVESNLWDLLEKNRDENKKRDKGHRMTDGQKFFRNFHSLGISTDDFFGFVVNFYEKAVTTCGFTLNNSRYLNGSDGVCTIRHVLSCRNHVRSEKIIGMFGCNNLIAGLKYLSRKIEKYSDDRWDKVCTDLKDFAHLSEIVSKRFSMLLNKS